MATKPSPCRPSDDHVPCPPPHGSNTNSVLFLTFGVVGAAVLLVAYLIFVKRFYANLNNSPRRTQVTQTTTPDEDREEFVDENQGPVLDHPIWYIRTVGLQQSIIESIAVFKYKRAEGLIEGTECSVCLSEFQEDETLRLLPKCSHAFHIPCIDTWLRSHKNCPLCRAPIVRDLNITAQANAQTEPNLNDAGSSEATQAENLENLGEAGEEEVTNEMAELPTEERITPTNDILPKDSHNFNTRNCELRVSSDLVGRHPKVLEEELQPVRRSVSMDNSSASAIYLAVAELERRPSTQLVRVKKPNSEKRGNRNSSLYRVVKSCSFGPSSKKGSISMKRSSSSRRFSSRSQDPILPV